MQDLSNPGFTQSKCDSIILKKPENWSANYKIKHWYLKQRLLQLSVHQNKLRNVQLIFTEAHSYNKDVAPHKHKSDFGHMAIIRAKESYEEKVNRV